MRRNYDCLCPGSAAGFQHPTAGMKNRIVVQQKIQGISLVGKPLRLHCRVTVNILFFLRERYSNRETSFNKGRFCRKTKNGLESSPFLIFFLNRRV